MVEVGGAEGVALVEALFDDLALPFAGGGVALEDGDELAVEWFDGGDEVWGEEADLACAEEAAGVGGGGEWGAGGFPALAVGFGDEEAFFGGDDDFFGAVGEGAGVEVVGDVEGVVDEGRLP